jgi:hypothetical protein
MSDDRLITAIGRLERALSRIEARGTLPPRAPSVPQTAHDGLPERHRLLQSRTRAAIERLDRLIASSAPPPANSGGGEPR